MDPADSEAKQQPTQPEQTTQSSSPFEQVEKEFVVIEQRVVKRFRDHSIFSPFIIVVIILLILAIIALLFPKNNSDKSQSATPTVTPSAVKTANPKTAAKNAQLLVYGTWTSQTSVIRAVDLTTDKTTTVATLPLTIKKVTILSNSTLLYIDQTDNNDHGARISVYDTQQKQIVTNIPAADGFVIDDYVLSPNKKYLAIWEVAFSSDTQALQGGQSRVYTVDLTRPSVTNLLYDETATPTIPIHYPRAILNDGTVFTDQFIPNDPKGGTGWAYGMSTVDFDGTNKQDIGSMNNGTYGSQPSLSSDGKYLLFAGYDGTNGDGTAVKNGYRQALLTPNTVELLDTKSLQRYKLANLPNSNVYSDVQWDNETGNIILSILAPDAKHMGVYSYDPGKLHLTQMQLPTANGTPYGFISQLPDTKTLIGIQSTDAANLGNLGDTYAYAYTQLAKLDSAGKLSYVSVEDPFVQYITILPGNYFKSVLGAQTKAQAPPQPSITYAILQGNNNGPSDFTFFLKTTLASLRLAVMSNPVGTNAITCQNLGDTRCSALGLPQKSTAFTTCKNIEKATNRTANACY